MEGDDEVLTLGSLFDGSGGFPLAGVINGIIPLWASEIEPYPLRVTEARFPNMKQLGDITKIDGSKIEPVDIITFGSPCQDLSIAGKQAGIHEGERSSLFFDAIRIIKEMRCATNGQYPRYAVWENVKGAFSSNQRADFAAVLEAFAGIMQDDISVPVPKKWEHAGCLVGDGWSVAWRLYDAQYWGVPQRRQRIYLIADFGSECAGEVLFKCESLSGNSEQSEEKGQRTSRDSSESIRETGKGCVAFAQNQRDELRDLCDKAGCLNAEPGVHQQTYVLSFQERAGKPGGGKGILMQGDHVGALSTVQNQRVVAPAICVGNGQANMASHISVELAQTLNCMHDQQIVLCDQGGSRMDVLEGKTSTLRAESNHPPIVPVKAVDGYNGAIDDTQSTLGVNCGMSTGRNAVLYEMQHASDVIRENDGVAPTLQHRMGTGGNNIPLTLQDDEQHYIVRRLTPLECCRLQGFPDWWEDGIDGSDSARYKMWGNGIALPCAVDVLGRIAKVGA